MRNATNVILDEAGFFFQPLVSALASSSDLTLFLRRFGYDLDPTVLDDAIASLTPLKMTAEDLLDGTAPNVRDLLEQGFSGLDTFRTAIETLSDLDDLPNKAENLLLLPEDVFHALLFDYLHLRAPTAAQLLRLLGIAVTTTIPDQNDDRSRGHEYIFVRHNWARISQLFSEPGVWAEEVYGWSEDFEHADVVERLGNFFDTFVTLTRFEEMTPSEVSTFLPRLVGEDEDDIKLVAPFLAKLTQTAHAEFGVAVIPIEQGAEADRGLAIGPYSSGSFTDSTPPLTVTGELGAVGGVLFALNPSGFAVLTGSEAANFSATFGLEWETGPAAPERLIFLGTPDTTRVDAQRVSLKAGGTYEDDETFDVYLAGGVKDLRITIAPGENNLLDSIISAPIVVEVGDLGIGWRPNQGLYFEGGSNLGVVIPLNRSIGPMTLHEVGVALDFARPALNITASADLTIGPLFASADQMGVSAALVETPDNSGVLGKHDLTFGFIPPTGYSVALQSDVVTGGGLISITENEYRGALALYFQNIGFSAFAILNTELPDDQAGFSFAASIFAEFQVPLSFGFVLTGLGGFIGVNRTINTDALREAVFDGGFDTLLFPEDPIAQANTILDDLAAVLPPRAGQHVVGPVARIGWGKPILLEVTLGVMLELGDEVRIVLLGGMAAVLPDPSTALVELRLSFFGEIDFSAQTISFDASLQGSRILTFPLTGDSAIRTGWAPRIEHLASFGGLHPEFPRPTSLPDLRRFTISLGVDNPEITVSGYAAITSNSLQFGGRADLYAEGPDIIVIGQIAAEGYLYLDALIYFDPFAFDVAVGGGLSLLRNGRTVLELGFALRLKGPNTFEISGRVWARLLGRDVGFAITAHWGSPQSLPAPSVDVVEILRVAVADSKGFEVLPATGALPAVTFVTATEDLDGVVDPVGGLRFTQTKAPLAIGIQKVGEAQIANGPATFAIVPIDADGQEAATQPASQSFVYGHFFSLTESERLSNTAFETYQAGFDLADQALSGATDHPIEAVYDYEYIKIPLENDAPNRRSPGGLADMTNLETIVDRFGVRTLDLRYDPGRVLRVFPPVALPPQVAAPVYIPEPSLPDVVDIALQPPIDIATDFGPDLIQNGLGAPSVAEAGHIHGQYDALSSGGEASRLLDPNPTLASYVFAANLV